MGIRRHDNHRKTAEQCFLCRPLSMDAQSFHLLLLLNFIVGTCRNLNEILKRLKLSFPEQKLPLYEVQTYYLSAMSQ